MFRFLYKFSFFRYFDSLMSSIKNGGRAIIAPCIFIAFNMYVFAFSRETPYMGWAGLFEPLILIGFCNIFIAFSRDSSPSIVNLQPISMRKRTLYDFIVPILMAVLGVIFFLVLCYALTFIFYLFLFIFTGENMFDMFVETLIFSKDIFTLFTSIEYPEVGIYGSLTFVGYCIIVYSSAMRQNSFVSAKSKVIYMASVMGGMLLLLYITAAPAAVQEISSYVFGNYCYTATPVPWLFSTLWLAAAVGVTVDMIIATVRMYKKKRSL